MAIPLPSLFSPQNALHSTYHNVQSIYQHEFMIDELQPLQYYNTQ